MSVCVMRARDCWHCGLKTHAPLFGTHHTPLCHPRPLLPTPHATPSWPPPTPPSPHPSSPLTCQDLLTPDGRRTVSSLVCGWRVRREGEKGAGGGERRARQQWGQGTMETAGGSPVRVGLVCDALMPVPGPLLSLTPILCGPPAASPTPVTAVAPRCSRRHRHSHGHSHGHSRGPNHILGLVCNCVPALAASGHGGSSHTHMHSNPRVCVCVSPPAVHIFSPCLFLSSLGKGERGGVGRGGGGEC